jgi:CelD/BcsL family acetyltransferase involved in cellulose biosynthesis
MLRKVQRSWVPTDSVFRPLPARPHASGDIAVQFMTSADDFARLAPDWNRLHEEADAASVFNSWISQYQWWQVYGAGQPLRILVALEHGQTLGILALYIQTIRVLGLRVRLLRFVGSGADTHPDDLGPVLAPGREEAVARALAQAALHVSDADVVLLTDIDPRSPLPRALEQAAAAARREPLTGISERIAYIDLPRSWGEFVASLRSNRRTRLKSARRKLAVGHRVRFFVWQDAEALDGAFERLAELHQRRWRQAGGSESFATPQYVAFHRGIMKATLPRGWLRLYCLELDGEIAAMTYCYRFRNRVYLMQAGFDPACANLNPGKVLLGYALEHAISEGNEVFDFLRGEHRYKDQFATGYRTTLGVRIFRPSLGALAYRLRRIFLPSWKARLLGAPPPKLVT